MTQTNLVNRTGLSLILGKNFSTIDSWIRQGMPYVKKGSKSNEWLFDTAQVIIWRENKLREEVWTPDRMELDEAKRRKMVAEAGILEIELQAKRRSVILREEIEQKINHAYLTIKQRLRTIPERVVPQLIGENEEQIARELLINEIDDALLELSQLDFHASDPE